MVRASFGETVGQGGITPAMIGVISLVAEHPGISQAELARVMGLERATVGTTVVRTIEAGFVSRTDAHDDGRRYALSLTPRGQRALRTLRRRIDAHESLIAGHLTAGERRRLRQLLHKLSLARMLAPGCKSPLLSASRSGAKTGPLVSVAREALR